MKLELITKEFKKNKINCYPTECEPEYDECWPCTPYKDCCLPGINDTEYLSGIKIPLECNTKSLNEGSDIKNNCYNLNKTEIEKNDINDSNK